MTYADQGCVVAGAERGAVAHLGLDLGDDPLHVLVDDVHGLADVLVRQARDQLRALGLDHLGGAGGLAQQAVDGVPHAGVVELAVLLQLLHRLLQVRDRRLHLVHDLIHGAEP